MGRSRWGSWGRGSAMGNIGSFNPALLVHGQQAVTLNGPLPVEGTVTLQQEVTGMYDKGKNKISVCVPPSQPLGEYNFEVKVPGVGKLDPRVDVY